MATIPLEDNQSLCPGCNVVLTWKILKVDRLTQIKYCRSCLDTVTLWDGGCVDRFYMRKTETPPPVIRFGSLLFDRRGNGLDYFRRR